MMLMCMCRREFSVFPAWGDTEGRGGYSISAVMTRERERKRRLGTNPNHRWWTVEKHFKLSNPKKRKEKKELISVDTVSVLDTLFSYSQLRPLKFLHCKLLWHLPEEHFPCCYYFCCFVFSRTRRSNSGRWQREELTVSLITMVRDEQILPLVFFTHVFIFTMGQWEM